MNSTIVCGAQQPGQVPSPFSWQGFAAIGTGAGLIGIGYAVGNALFGASTVAGAYLFTAGAAGAAAIFAVVLYYAFQADGCIISPTKGSRRPCALSGPTGCEVRVKNSAFQADGHIISPTKGSRRPCALSGPTGCEVRVKNSAFLCEGSL